MGRKPGSGFRQGWPFRLNCARDHHYYYNQGESLDLTNLIVANFESAQAGRQLTNASPRL